MFTAENITITPDYYAEYPNCNTVECSTDEMTYVFTGIEFHPITPRVTHVYHLDRYLGAVCADDNNDFLMDLAILLNTEF